MRNDFSPSPFRALIIGVRNRPLGSAISWLGSSPNLPPPLLSLLLGPLTESDAPSEFPFSKGILPHAFCDHVCDLNLRVALDLSTAPPSTWGRFRPMDKGQKAPPASEP